MLNSVKGSQTNDGTNHRYCIENGAPCDIIPLLFSLRTRAVDCYYMPQQPEASTTSTEKKQHLNNDNNVTSGV